MSDFAIDYNTGDFKLSPTKDIGLRTGRATVDQRIRVRLRIAQGQWINDPTHGALGSRIDEQYNVPTWRAAQELELVIREAIEPMDDVQILTLVAVPDPKNSRQILVSLTYTVGEDVDVSTEDIQTFDTAIIAGV